MPRRVMCAKQARLQSSRLLPLLDDFSADESIKKMKFAVEICVAFLEQISLMSRTHAAARRFAVACVQFVDDAHAFYYLAKWREAHHVEARLIARVDINLPAVPNPSGLETLRYGVRIVTNQRLS